MLEIKMTNSFPPNYRGIINMIQLTCSVVLTYMMYIQNNIFLPSKSGLHGDPPNAFGSAQCPMLSVQTYVSTYLV